MALNMVKKIFILTALIVAIVPAVFVLQKAGGLENWQGVPSQGITDSLYYYARMHEVSDGHPLIGNPYIFEYREAYSPAFFLPDVITAMPLLFGIPFNVAIWINVFIWSFVFLFFAYRLLTLLHVSERWATAWSIFLYLGSYSFMLRPTVMQTILPLFLFFLITLIQFLYEPLSKKRALWLASASALTFYFYNYLAFVVFLTFAFIFLWFLVSKQFKALRALMMTGVYTSLLLIPFGIYSLMQMSGPMYRETLSRIGLVYTHIPAMEAFFFGRWIVIGVCALVALWFFFPKKEGKDTERKIFWISTGCALFVGLFLNVITGVELSLGIHIGRFVMPWMILLLGVFLYEWYFSYTRRSRNVTLLGHTVIGVFVLFLLMGTVRNIPRALSFFEFDNRGYTIAELQAYGGPLAWLESNLPEESVIWSNMSIAGYVPIMTKHYTLFHVGATLHAISEEELEERYLLWRSLEPMTITEVKRDFNLYAGAGRHKELPLAQNNRALFCNMLSRFIDMGECPQKTDAIALQGEPYFERLAERFALVKANQADLLRKYNVSYLIVDTRYDTTDAQIPESSAVYADGRFLIFPITALAQI